MKLSPEMRDKLNLYNSKQANLKRAKKLYFKLAEKATPANKDNPYGSSRMDLVKYAVMEWEEYEAREMKELQKMMDPDGELFKAIQEAGQGVMLGMAQNEGIKQ
jgi:hypothetical protein